MSDCRFGVSQVNYPDPDPERHFQQFFSHITTVSGCDRKLNAHFYSVASLKYAPDT